MSETRDSAGQIITYTIPQCGCGKQNSAGICEHVNPQYFAQPIPSGGERPIMFVCAKWKKLSDGCVARCDKDQHHTGIHVDSVIAISWHDQPTPAAQPEEIGSTTVNYNHAATCRIVDSIVKARVPESAFRRDVEPVSAEATKPAGGEIPVHWDKSGNVDMVVQFGNSVPPVAPPEAEGAREWLRKHHPYRTLVSSGRAIPLAPVLEAYATFKLAQKEAEISRLTAERDEIAKALMIDFDGFLWSAGFENKPDGFETLVAACQALYEDAEAVQKAKDDLVATNTDLRTALQESVKLQSHYAGLLNMHDGGQRIQFASADIWMKRLAALAKGE